MRLSQIWPALPAVLVVLSPAVRADDTEEFLKPSNWEGRSDIWKIEKGTIVGETKEDPKYNTFFCSKPKYGDFELSFKATLRDGIGNSGVQIRSEVFDAKLFKVKGPQVDIGKGYWGSLYGEGVGGMIVESGKEKIAKAVKETEANAFHIVAKGNKIKVTVNGEVMVDGEYPQTKDKKPFPAEGIIAFQAHAGYPKMRIEFADIKFKKLSK